tara:strand:- start:23 stop:208 length:186 start_codon:yes stop_codon:yes gene_type:complete
MEEFFQMGGYAKFIWSAYIIVALVLIGLWVISQRFQRSSAETLKKLNDKSRRESEKPSNEA